jgi:peptidyl-tRNA hydrolase
MKPNEIATFFSEYIEEGTTPKGMKVQSFFSHLSSSQKRLLANNISKSYASYLQAEKEKAVLQSKKKKEISELKKRAKELGLIISEK